MICISIYKIFNVYGEIFIGYYSRKDVCRRVKVNRIKTDYEVTITGNVYNVVTGLKLSPAIVNRYYKILIYYTDRDGVKTRKQISIHRLVADTFIPNPYNKKEVHHIDEDPLNNDVTNLLWVTNKEHNLIHQKLGKFQKSARYGESNNFCKTTEDTVRKICNEFIINELTPPEIAKKYGVSRKTVTLLLHKKRWPHITKDMDFSNYDKLRYVSKEEKDKVIELLKDTNLSLLDISNLTGVSHTYVSHINRMKNIRKKNLIVKRSTTRERLQKCRTE